MRKKIIWFLESDYTQALVICTSLISVVFSLINFKFFTEDLFGALVMFGLGFFLMIQTVFNYEIIFTTDKKSWFVKNHYDYLFALIHLASYLIILGIGIFNEEFLIPLTITAIIYILNPILITIIKYTIRHLKEVDSKCLN